MLMSFFNLKAFKSLVDEENQRDKEKCTKARRVEELKEQEEIEAAKAKSLRLAKEEKKQRKAEMRTKGLNEGASSSSGPFTASATMQTKATPIQKTTETIEPMDTKHPTMQDALMVVMMMMEMTVTMMRMKMTPLSSLM